jgi:hypothetical protein
VPILPSTATDLRFSRVFPDPQHSAVPCEKARYRSRTEEAKGSNPLTSTPPQPWSPAGRVASAELSGSPGSRESLAGSSRRLAPGVTLIVAIPAVHWSIGRTRCS